MRKGIKICSYILLLVLLSSSVVFASEASKDVQLQVVNGKLENMDNLQQVIDDYFASRVDVFEKYVNKSEFKEKISSFADGDSTFISNEMQRLNYIDNLAKNHGVYVVDATNTYTIESISQVNQADIKDFDLSNDEYYNANIYEWTWIDYNDGKESAIDRMGYATDHIITFRKDIKGKFSIVKDSYDESEIMGSVNTTPIYKTEKNNELAVINPIITTTYNSSVTLDINRLIDYADEWVVHEYSSIMQNTAYYNRDVFGYYSEDCANFTSQCLYTGGMTNDYGSGKDNTNWDGTQWWFDTYPDPQYENYDVSPPSWRYVPKFVEYWENQGYSVVGATSSSVYPGNPVLNNESHVGICVGYNSSGTPIINAHDRDVYHVPYTMIGSGTRTTIQIATSNLMINKPSTAINLIPTTTNQTKLCYIAASESDYFKFTVTSANYYTLEATYYSTYTTDTYGYLYKESQQSNGQTLYLYEVAKDDDSGYGLCFKIRQYLPVGTYYVRIRGYSKSTTGYYYINYKIG